MRIDILTIFPEIFSPLDSSIIKRAKNAGLIEIHLHNLRDFTTDKHKTVDDAPFGGGAGMIMKCEPFFDGVEHIRKISESKGKVILLCPQGKLFTQEKALELSCESHLIFLCGHYEGVDERAREFLADEEISIGDYVLTGGEIPCMVVVDAVARLIPGVIDEESLKHESFSSLLLDFPQYTRPSDFRGMKAPEILLSGNHAGIEKWRNSKALERTLRKRPDLQSK
ncbi:MAG: tRNA (guanosine(37)-N1)-methyltransferase TrmD [Firmicutes bacterium]|nr:tRNA (guanosine(37)-N1)-methyltransferase TrmD [Bacillota bacterium]